MNFWTKKYLDSYLLVYALYAYLNKGIAYSFLAEALLGIGLLLVLFQFRKLELPKANLVLWLVLFLFINALFMFRGFAAGYSPIDVIRDSFILNYALFAFILLFLHQHINYLFKGLCKIYALYPIIQTIHFLVLSYVPHADEFQLFGSISLLHYKYGDMAVHLFISLLLLLTGKIVLPTRFAILNLILIGYLFLIASSFSRAGMVCFVFTGLLFYITVKDEVLKKQIRYYARFVPIFLLIAIPLYQLTKTKENFQGRKTGITQIADNVTSIVATEKKGSTQSDNNVWRLVWWTKILEYTFTGPYFLAGKGLGMSLATDDDIEMSEDNELRSPHNFHLNILARYGVPFFFLWLYWIFRHAKLFKRKDLSAYPHLLLCCFFIFLLNASFDVYLEGPMGAFAFWTFAGLLYTELYFKHKAKSNPIAV